MRRRIGPSPLAALGFVLLLFPCASPAAALEGGRLSMAWGLPFAGLLLSIALGPLLAPALWHRHFGKVAAGWAAAFLLPCAGQFGAAAAGAVVVHALLAEYLPFIVLLATLFTVAGGIHIRGEWHGSPASNTVLLALGAGLASLMGTTGATMLLIHPLIRANRGRRDAAHRVVFFIFIVGNVGGALTPLGDPPLFLGFLQGVEFFWTTRHLGLQTLFAVGVLLGVFYLVDRRSHRREGAAPPVRSATAMPIGLDGAINLLPLLAAIAAVLLSGVWKPGITVDVLGTGVGLQHLLRDALLVALMLTSLAITPAGVRARNGFSWAPMQEVALLFAGIFLTMAPVLAMLQAGEAGAFAAVARGVTGADGRPWPAAYFWLTGGLSAFLDNAPTYLVFFNLAGGDASQLMTTGAPTLTAISAGAVFMGALTYIGNAPNFMVKAIAEDRGVRMPGFFGYMLWSGAVLLPLYAVMTWIWF